MSEIWFGNSVQISNLHVVLICTEESDTHYHINATSIFESNPEHNQRVKLTHCLSTPFPVLLCDPLVHSVSIISVLSVCVWSMIVLVHWETLLNERVPQMSRTPPRFSSTALCACMDTVYTPIPVPAFVWVLEFAPTNRPLNLTHIQHIQTYQKPPGVTPLTSFFLPLECVSRHNSNRTTFESSPILRKPVGFPGANEMPARQMDMREPQSDPTLGSK